MVRRLIVPPTEPSIVFASGDLVTSTAEIIDALTSSKSIPLRPDPEPTVETPLNSILFALVPRICTPLPTPAVLVICIPVTFSRTSARFWSGSLPMSSAMITSTRLSEARFSANAFSNDARIPVTTISSSSD